MVASKLTVRDLAAAFGKRVVLENVSLSLHRGFWTSVVGANGAGKTTLLQALAGWRRPLAGAIQLDDQSPDAYYRQEVVLAPAPEQLPRHLLGQEIIDIVCRERGRTTDVNWGAALATLDGAEWLKRPAGELSWGTRKKVCLAVALCTSPAFILLDEGFDGLDSASSIRIRDFVRSEVEAGKIGVVSASHAWESVFCDSDEVVFLDQGRIVRRMGKGEFQSLGDQARRIQQVVLDAFAVKSQRPGKERSAV